MFSSVLENPIKTLDPIWNPDHLQTDLFSTIRKMCLDFRSKLYLKNYKIIFMKLIIKRSAPAVVSKHVKTRFN